MSTTAMNDWEQRGRAAKAYRLARVLARYMAEAELSGFTLASWRRIDDETRRRASEVAGLKRPPSDLTWQMACDLAETMLMEAYRERA